MPYLSKYGVARTIRIPMVKRGLVDHAVSADWTPAAGDVKISKDGGAAANVTNLPTALAMGNSTLWLFALTATEMQAAQITVTIADSATKAVEDSAFDIETYGNAAAQHQVDFTDIVRMGLTALPNAVAGASGGLPLSADASGRVDLIKVNGTSQTAGDIIGKIGTPAGASVSVDIASLSTKLGAPAGASVSADIAAVKVDTANIYSKVDTEIATIISVLGTPSATIAADIAAIPAATTAAVVIGVGGIVPTANQNADALLDRVDGVESGMTVRKWLRLAGAVLFGKALGMGGTTATFRDLADSKNRITATVDANGDRTVVTLDPS